MSAASKRRNEIPATVVLIDHAWFVSFVLATGDAKVLPVDETQAWNFDIERFLPVWIDATQALEEPGTCTILRRKGNKKFVRVAAAL